MIFVEYWSTHDICEYWRTQCLRYTGAHVLFAAYWSTHDTCGILENTQYLRHQNLTIVKSSSILAGFYTFLAVFGR